MSSASRRSFLKASGAAVTVGALAGCTGGQNAADPIVIGAIEPLSGPFAPWGAAHRSGLEFAVEEINADGGVGGRELRVTVADTGSDPAEADSVFRRFVEQEGAVAVTGPVSSDVGIRTAQTAQDLQVPNLLHMAGSNDVITPDTTFAFRVGILPAATGLRAQAGLIESEGYTKVGAIIADYGWGRSVEESINEEFPFDIQIEAAPVGASDFKPSIRKFPTDLEMMVATGHPPGSLTITSQLYELGYEPEAITGAGLPPGVIAGALGDDAFKAFTHIHNTDVYTDRFAEIGERYASATDQQFSTHSGYGYVTGRLLAAAVDSAGDADPMLIRDALLDIEFDTLFGAPIAFSDHGELDGTVQIYSQLRAGGPSHFPSGSFHLEEQFRTEPLPALPPDR